MPCYKRKEIRKLLRSMSTPELVAIHNRYLETTEYPDEGRIYSMRDFDKVFAGKSPLAIAKTIYYSKDHLEEFQLSDLYFSFKEFDQLVSFSCATRYPSPINLYVLADYIDDTGDALGSGKIQKLFDEPGEYQKLRAAVDTAPTQENVNALGEWLCRAGYFWTGDSYDCGDGICIYCVWDEGGEDEDDEIVGFEIRKNGNS